MNHKQKRKLIGMISLIILLSLASALILYALKQNINLFYTPTQLADASLSPHQVIRIGGYVKKGSIDYDSSGEIVHFIITDRSHEINVSYEGVLPNLFREEQTVVVTGKRQDEKTLIATQVLAKHDEKYIPSSLAKELKKGNDDVA